MIPFPPRFERYHIYCTCNEGAVVPFVSIVENEQKISRADQDVSAHTSGTYRWLGVYRMDILLRSYSNILEALLKVYWTVREQMSRQQTWDDLLYSQESVTLEVPNIALLAQGKSVFVRNWPMEWHAPLFPKDYAGLYLVPAHRPEAGNFCFGPVTFQTYKPGWLVKILSNVIVIQLLGL